MKSFFYSSAFLEEFRTVHYPDGFRAADGISESVNRINCNCFCESTRSIFLDGIHIEERTVEVKEEFSIDVRHDFPFIKMQFELEGYSNFSSGISSVPDVEIIGGHHQLFYLPEVKGRLSYGRNRSTLEIKLTLDFLNRTLDGRLDALQEFGKSLIGGSPKLLSSAHMPITLEMRKVIANIRNCPFKGIMKKVFLECKVTELLLLQIGQLQEEDARRRLNADRSLDRLYQVKKIIADNLEKPKTIIELAELAGINDFKLKKEFKLHFGDTLFGYLTKLRLEKSRGLLLSGASVKEVALRIGYRQPQHFTVAFKRQFGYLPSVLNKEQ